MDRLTEWAAPKPGGCFPPASLWPRWLDGVLGTESADVAAADVGAAASFPPPPQETFLEKHNVKLGFMSVFVKAAAHALQACGRLPLACAMPLAAAREAATSEAGSPEVPSVNAVIEGDEIIFRDFYDISIAVATPKNINALGKKARDGTIGIDDMAGGTFTISNGGVYGSLLPTPIINPPQWAILGMHTIVDRPVVVKSKPHSRFGGWMTVAVPGQFLIPSLLVMSRVCHPYSC
ncbi:hypothetical protein CHLRE_07g343433v5 [Chlamydomonas reinhardtii]|uniref:dihydrolipoyllysine-residue succinyltransferase n=1 Tax=Chlamydomonas reinhardtii TaxID=3055 RepID=A0A2K3DKS5_CHLRE|nr:uncharacterized protein CHLRE_07g343433v5 [Chlamydomonas reinhardtii]PNW81121.1 hypothetical protein CHLRE_07g343433v5 [Chlamydomonas reinhardtii]